MEEKNNNLNMPAESSEKTPAKKSFKTKFLLIAVLIVVLAASTISVYAYFSTRAKVYTSDTGESQYFRAGMEINTFFDIINSSATTKVTDGQSLGIVCTNTSCGALYTDGMTMAADTVYYKNVGTDSSPSYVYVYNSNADWGSASNPYIISQIYHFQNLFILQNYGFFESYTKKTDDSGNLKNTEDCMPYFLVCESDGTPVTLNGQGKKFEYIGNDEYPFIGYLGGAFVSGTTTVDGKESSQSVIYNLVSITDSDIIDVGLFGRIGYLGDDSTAVEGKFKGSVSTVRDLLLYDVQVKVESKSAWTSILDKIKQHVYTFGKGSTVMADTTTPGSVTYPCENHHIGILAGHVDYATVENISVYYSSTSVSAIDVQHSHISSTSDAAANYYSVSGILGFCYEMNSVQADGEITIGSGRSNSDIDVSSGGVGSGGGLESGLGRGYVTAAEIFGAYNDSGEIVKCTIPVTQTNPDGTEYTTNTYKYGLVIIYDKDLDLEYGSSGSTTDWSLQDRTTPVEITGNASSGYKATIYSTYENFFGIEQSTSQDWAEFVIYNTGDGKYYYYKSGASTLSEISNVTTTGISLRYAAAYSTSSGAFTNLCTQYERSRIGSTITGWTQATDRYYFYDGVFTFALSDPTDTIDKTWDCSDASGVDTFYVGENNTSEWVTDTKTGNKAVVSYVKQLTTTAELKSLEAAGKDVYIIYEDTSANKEYLVTLAKNSTYSAGNGEDALFTDCTALSFVDSDTSEELKKTVESGAISSPVSGVTNAELVANWSNYKILNIASSSDTNMNLSTLAEYYNIDTTFTPKESETTYKNEYGNTFPTASNITVTAGTGILESGLQHTWDGFIAFETTSTDWYWTRYRCKLKFYYVTPSGGQSSLIQTSDYADYYNSYQPYDVGNGVTYQYDSYGVKVYSLTVNGKTYTGPLLYLEGGKYYSSWEKDWSKVITYSGSSVVGSDYKYTSTYTFTHPYFTAETSDTGTVYQYLGSGTALASEPTIVEGKTTTIGGIGYSVYTDGTHEGILISRNASNGYYTFSSTREGTKYTLRMLRRAYPAASRYSILCADDTYASTASNYVNEWGNKPSLTNSTEATVVPTGDGRFYISYEINGNTRYLAYGASVSGASGPCFHGTSSKSDACKLYIYSVEGSQDINYGYVTYQPRGTEGTYSKTYKASEYVLWPNQVYDGTDSTSSYKPSSSSDYTTDPTYSVKSLSSLFGSNWKNSNGAALSYNDLSSVFCWGDGISEIDIVSLWGGESATNFNTEYIKAPIGTTGEEAYIPTGCVAFRVNESGTDNKIRVIVAVPTSDYYYGQTINGTVMNPVSDGDGYNIDYSEDYYFCMWKCPEAGEETSTTINLDNCSQAFEIPRSNPYKPGTTAASSGDYVYNSNITGGGSAAANSVKNYINITDGSNTYRSYLNGSTVLVAYEFNATEEGVYVLGSNHECRIVYFSADAASSSGKDGTSSYKLGTIDFVYDNETSTTSATAIITVDKADPDSTDGTVVYTSYYYPTLCLLYTDNLANGTNGVVSGDTDYTGLYPNINDFKINVRRYQSETASHLTWKAYGGSQPTSGGAITDAAYLQFVRYSIDADDITRDSDELR